MGGTEAPLHHCHSSATVIWYTIAVVGWPLFLNFSRAGAMQGLCMQLLAVWQP